MTLTLTQLAKQLAGTGDPDRVKTVIRRVDHWHGVGLFKLVRVDLGPERIGRGRVRRYPENATSWCRLWNSLADQGLGAPELVKATGFIQLTMLNSEEKFLIEAAMQGDGPALFLIMDSPPAEFTHTWSGNWKIARSPIQLGESWRGGRFINLTAAFNPDRRPRE